MKAGRVVLDLFLFFKKALYEVKPSGQQLSFNFQLYFGSPQLGHKIQIHYIDRQTADPEISSTLMI